MRSIAFYKTFFKLFFASASIVSCAKKPDVKVTETEKSKFAIRKAEVETTILKKKNFEEELIFNGKLIALQKSILRFQISGRLDKLLVKNGQYVNKNSFLAFIESFSQRQALETAQINYKKSKLEFEDMLISRGYDPKQKDSIPAHIYEMASIRSGQAEAQKSVDNLKYQLSSTTLKAPFSGKISNIKYKEYEHVNAGSEFLTLIDDSAFEVEFYILESEIRKIQNNQPIEVVAYNEGENYEGKISSINPVIEKNGTILVKAIVKNDGQLVEGMNVKIKLKKNVLDQYVVPKEAILIRQNQEVLFKYINGKSFWTYVNTLHENSESYAIQADPKKSSSSLKINDTIIISGNINLAHDTEVKILNHFN